jgi:hypothetical protein
MNIFHLRLSLANIEGKIYHLLYTGRSRKVHEFEQEKRVTDLQMMLDSWYARVPIAFRIEEATLTVGSSVLVQITNLYRTYMLCCFTVHGLYSHKAEWLQKVSSLSRAALHEFAISTQGQSLIPCRQITHAPLAQGWQRCVNVSRDSMALLRAIKLTEFTLW